MKIVLIILLILIIYIFYMPFKIIVIIKRKDEDDMASLGFSFFKGLIKFNYEIPYLDLIMNKNELDLKVKSITKEKNTKKDLKKERNIIGLEKITNTYKKIKKYKRPINEMTEYIINKINFNVLSWQSKIGLGDAALTGISHGIVWTAISILLNTVLNNKKIDKLSINIYPEFNKNIFEFDFCCIITLKIVYIIIAGIKGLKVHIRGGVLNG